MEEKIVSIFDTLQKMKDLRKKMKKKKVMWMV